MKIKKIAGVCKARGTAHLWDAPDGRQYIYTGASAYPVEGLPDLTEEHLATILDLSAKQLDDMNIQHLNAPDDFRFGDTCGGEVQTVAEIVNVVYLGDTLMPFSARGETWFIERTLREPIFAEHDDAVLFLRRTEGGQAYFAVKSGLLLVGLVWPREKLGHMVKQLGGIASGYRGDEADAEESIPPFPPPTGEETRNLYPEQMTLLTGSNRSEGPRPKPKLTRGGDNAFSSPVGEKNAPSAAKNHSGEALEWIAKRKAKLNRWTAPHVAEVAHPKYGSVVVPYNSNLDAVECAAEYWGCSTNDISGAQVKLAAPGAVPVAMPW